MRPLPSIISSVVLCGLLTAGVARAEKPRMHFPLDHRAPIGQVAHWHVLANPCTHAYPQPVKISVPGSAKVTFFDGSDTGATVDAPGQAKLPVGYAYRVRISDLSDFPGVELFPTVEVLDRLHPPANLVDEYPIPIELTADEIEAVLADRMVTKVVYLERQDLPRPPHRRAAVEISEVSPRTNLLESATQMGRPVAILRVGGRTMTAADRDELMAPPVPVEVTQATRQTP
ncbi:MAG: hypothetical protein JNG89_13575 [Planctomycetaceae bacterium]|nr:hypothetical protein [Planctomycetaceae bacterium]